MARTDGGGAPITVVSGGDDRFARSLAVTLHTAALRSDPHVPMVLYVLDGGITTEHRRRIEHVLAHTRDDIEVHWCIPDAAQLADLPATRWHSRAAYLRLLIPQLLPADVERVIYLDSDVLVERDLTTLWHHPMGDALALGVENYSDPEVGAPNALPETFASLGLDAHTPYCNTGVMVIDVARWRDDGIADLVLAFTREHADVVRFADQDGINAVLGGRWGLLDPRWNVQVATLPDIGAHRGLDGRARRQLRRQLVRSPFIAHFTGVVKPWDPAYRGPFGERYARALRQCGWFERSQTATWLVGTRAPQVGLRVAARARQAALRMRDQSL